MMDKSFFIFMGYFVGGFGLAYLIGSIPFRLLLERLMTGQGLRQLCSENTGTTNVHRPGTTTAAALTVLLDGLKGFVPVWAVMWWHELAYLVALAVFLGHYYPIWLKFKGGTGIATGLGVHMALAWPVGVAMLVVWLWMAWWRRYSSLAALMAVGVGLIIIYTFYDKTLYLLTATVIAALIAVRHHENIRRLLQGTEEKIAL